MTCWAIFIRAGLLRRSPREGCPPPPGLPAPANPGNCCARFCMDSWMSGEESSCSNPGGTAAGSPVPALGAGVVCFFSFALSCSSNFSCDNSIASFAPVFPGSSSRHFLYPNSIASLYLPNEKRENLIFTVSGNDRTE